jgi:hypothetical protein
MKLSQKEKDELMENTMKHNDSIIELILIFIVCLFLGLLPFIW